MCLGRSVAAKAAIVRGKRSKGYAGPLGKWSDPNRKKVQIAEFTCVTDLNL